MISEEFPGFAFMAVSLVDFLLEALCMECWDTPCELVSQCCTDVVD